MHCQLVLISTPNLSSALPTIVPTCWLTSRLPDYCTLPRQCQLLCRPYPPSLSICSFCPSNAAATFIHFVHPRPFSIDFQIFPLILCSSLLIYKNTNHKVHCVLVIVAAASSCLASRADNNKNRKCLSQVYEVGLEKDHFEGEFSSLISLEPSFIRMMSVHFVLEPHHPVVRLDRASYLLAWMHRCARDNMQIVPTHRVFWLFLLRIGGKTDLEVTLTFMP